MTFASTVLYFHQGTLLRDAMPDRGERTEFLAWLDVLTNTLTLLLQAFVATRLMQWLRIGTTLAVVPGLAFLGYLGLGAYPTLLVIGAFMVLYRAGRYSIARPAREVCFTVVGREERYKSKAFIDAAVYRGGDLVNGWVVTGLELVGLSVAGIAFVAAPVMVVWAGVGLLLGRAQEEMRDPADAAGKA
jgi:AAA family ATP:ADP antiporter